VTTQERASATRLARGFWALVCATTLLIALGALVRANGAGLACPDWPLCFGEVIPEFDVKVGFEWSHRALAGSVAVGFVLLSIQTLRQPALGPQLRPWLAVAAVLLATQIILGALTVWQLLASWTVTSHLIVGNAVNAGFASIAWRLGQPAGRPRVGALPSSLARTLVVGTAVLLLLQIALGGQVSSRFAGLACDEWPACHAGIWFPEFAGARGLHLLHRLAGYALIVALVASALATRGTGRLAGLLLGAACLGALQGVVGIANVLLRIPVEVTGLHSLLAASLVLATTVACHEAFAGQRDPPASAL